MLEKIFQFDMTLEKAEFRLGEETKVEYESFFKKVMPTIKTGLEMFDKEIIRSLDFLAPDQNSQNSPFASLSEYEPEENLLSTRDKFIRLLFYLLLCVHPSTLMKAGMLDQVVNFVLDLYVNPTFGTRVLLNAVLYY